jgi:hypothetical protein
MLNSRIVVEIATTNCPSDKAASLRTAMLRQLLIKTRAASGDRAFAAHFACWP